MIYFRLSLIVMLVTLAGCGMSPATNHSTEQPADDMRDLTGQWDLIFHHEVGESVHILAKLIIQRMDCKESVCNLSGFVESDELGALRRLPLKYAYYYPELDFTRISYNYRTVDSFLRTVVLWMTDFPQIQSAHLAMAGEFIIFGNEAPATFFNVQDEEILTATRKGKAVHAGQATAWLRK